MAEKKKARLSCEVSLEENDRLEAVARYGGWSIAWVLRQALKEFLDRAEREGKIEVTAR